MKRIALTTLTLLAVATASGEYTVKVPLETNQGGSLPNGSILLGSPSTETQEPTPENWQPYEPAYTAWVNQGEPYGCTNWTPDVATITLGEEFEQTATDCQQDQTRSRQEREQETTTLAIRDIGTPTIENQTITGIDTRESTGTMETWDQFAATKGLSNNWNNLFWSEKTLSYIPSTPYPTTSVSLIYLNANNLTSIDGLISLTGANEIGISSNKLTNINGLSNLIEIRTGNLDLSNNQLSDVNGLSSLVYVNNDLLLYGNPIGDMSGLNKTIVGGRIFLPATYAGPKLPGSSLFCQNNPASKFVNGYAQIHHICTYWPGM
ncbi:TPA: hypothetical protein L4A53_005752 [Pseudomonas aeruginosa]|nr:hypothetical protein [Pseudomonas aeruginosa]HBO0257667.1 hypothetical protein [Pseudomonas aeruginosa]HBO0273626.1 hypothetical protein [Pseudomonas aeruginosa]